MARFAAIIGSEYLYLWGGELFVFLVNAAVAPVNNGLNINISPLSRPQEDQARLEQEIRRQVEAERTRVEKELKVVHVRRSRSRSRERAGRRRRRSRSQSRSRSRSPRRERGAGDGGASRPDGQSVTQPADPTNGSTEVESAVMAAAAEAATVAAALAKEAAASETQG